jgi:DNA polymerase-3 subunit chi
MTSISFYQLLTTPLEKTLPRLLEKIYASSKRAVVLVESEERLAQLDSVFWTYSTNAFLPHGSAKLDQEFHKRQPIWLTTLPHDNPNDAEVLVVTSGHQLDTLEPFQRVLDFFDGNTPTALANAQKRMDFYKNQGHSLTIWCQNLQGGWEEKSGLQKNRP